MTQGLSERDLRDAEPLPEALAAYTLPPGQGTQTNIHELGPLVRAEARKLGLEIVVRRNAENGELGFALRPKASSRLVDGDGPVANAEMTRLSCQMDHLPGACRYRDRGTRKMAGGKASTTISSNCRRINRHVFAILRVLRKYQLPGVDRQIDVGSQGGAEGRASMPDIGRAAREISTRRLRPRPAFPLSSLLQGDPP